MSAYELKRFTSWMWNDIFKGGAWDALKDTVLGISSNLVNNVVNIIFHSITPPLTNTIKNITLGRFDSEIGSHIVEQTCWTKNIGSIYIPRINGDYTDAMTEVEVYLPYCGFLNLSPHLVIGKTVNIKYICDVTSGACTAEIFCNGSLRYSVGGVEGCNVPYSMSNGEEYISSVMQFASKAGLVSSPIGAMAALSSGLQMEQPDIISGSNDTSASISQVMPQKAFILCKYAKKGKIGSSFAKEKGRVLNETKKLSELHGLTICSDPRIDTIADGEPPMMAGEYEMLMTAMKEGVIL